jgi:hypothetical protein
MTKLIATILAVIAATVVTVGCGASEGGQEAKRAVYYGESCQPPNITVAKETAECEEAYRQANAQKEVESVQKEAKSAEYQKEVEANEH